MTKRRTISALDRERLLARAMISPDGCWLWAGSITRNGYGKYYTLGPRAEQGNYWAHRAMYELIIGPIPAGLQLDHLCRVPRCVNPAHLEPVTAQENTLRSNSIAAKLAARTHCNHGHEFTPENTRWVRRRTHPGKKWRLCRTCDIARKRVKR